MTSVVAGRHPVQEFLRTHPSRAVRLVLAKGLGGASARELRALARAADVPVRVMSRQHLDRLAGGAAHQGVVLITTPIGYSTFHELKQQVEDAGDHALVIALDHITDPRNLGAVARAAAAAGAQGLIVPKDRSAALSTVALKTSAGALATLPVARVTNLARSLEELEAMGMKIAGTSPRGGRPPWESDLAGPLVVVLGSEGKGLGRAALARCTQLVTIPLSPGVQSLNVAAAAAVILYERTRQLARAYTPGPAEGA